MAAAAFGLAAATLLLSSVPAATAATAATTASTTVTPPATIRGDCRGDVTAALNAWLDSLPDGVTADLTGKCYQINTTVVIDHPLTVVGGTLRAFTDGKSVPPPPGATPDWPRGRKHMSITGHDVTIQGTTVVGANNKAVYNPALEAQHGFSVNGGNNVDLIGVTVRNVYGDGVAVNKGPANSGSSNVTVTGSTFDGIGRQGLSVSFGTDVLMENNIVDRVGRSGVDIEPQCATVCWEVRRITIRNNVFSRVTNFTVANLGNSTLVSDIVIDGNETVGQAFRLTMGTPAGVRSGYTVVGNASDPDARIDKPTLSFRNINGLGVFDNSVPVSCDLYCQRTGMPPVWLALDDVTAVTISGNNGGAGVIDRS